MPWGPNGEWISGNDPNMGYTQQAELGPQIYGFQGQKGLAGGGLDAPAAITNDMNYAGGSQYGNQLEQWTGGSGGINAPGYGLGGGQPQNPFGPTSNPAGFNPYAQNPYAYTGNSLLTPYGGFDPRMPGGGSYYNNATASGDIAARFREFGMQNGGDPSAVNDPNYWAAIYNEKVAKGADPQETFNYLAGRITNGSGGGGGGFSPGALPFLGGNYAPIAPFNFSPVSAGGYSAQQMQAPDPFHFGGPSVQPFNAPPGPLTPAPFSYNGSAPGGAVTNTSGQFVMGDGGTGRGPAQAPQFDEAGYLSANPDVAAAVQRGEIPSGFAHYQSYGRNEGRQGAQFTGGSLSLPGGKGSGSGVPGGPQMITNSGQQPGYGSAQGSMNGPPLPGNYAPGQTLPFAAPVPSPGPLTPFSGQPTSDRFTPSVSDVPAFHPTPFSATFRGQPMTSVPEPDALPAFDGQPLDAQPFGFQPFEQGFTYTPLETPGLYQAADQFTYQPLQTPNPYQGAGTFTYNPLTTPGLYQTPQEFVAPTDVTEQNDPGYQFRFKEGQRALENSKAAKGILTDGNTARALQEYGQGFASNEYGNVYARALGQHQQRAAEQLTGYQTNAQTQLAAQGQQFGQGLGAYEANQNNLLSAYQTNAQTGLAAQGQQFGQALSAGQFNEGNRLNAYQTNVQTQQGAQQQQFMQALAALQANQGIQAQNFGQSATATELNAALQGQTFGQQATAAQLNAALQGQNYGQILQGLGLGAQLQNQQFGQALSTNQQQAALQQQGFGQQLAGSQQNAALQNQGFGQGLAANQQGAALQGQQFTQGLQANQANVGNALSIYGANEASRNQAFQNQLQLGQAGYNQAFNTYNANAQNQLAFNQANYGQQAQTYGLNLGAQNQQFNQAAQGYGLSTGAALNAFQANSGAAYNAAALTQQGSLAAQQANLEAAMYGYGQQVQQNQFAAQLPLSIYGLNLQSQNQGFGQNLSTYNANQGNFFQNQNNQYGRLTGLAQLGNPGSPNAQQYGGTYADYLTQIGNAQAGGVVGAANANTALWTGIGNSAANAGLAYGDYRTRPRPAQG